MLTFELNDEAEKIEIHGDKQGLLKLANLLTQIANEENSASRNLMTKEWGGEELGSDKQGLDNNICHHVKIFLWDIG